MTAIGCAAPVRIPSEPCCLGEAIHSGVELELVPIGVHGMARQRAAVNVLTQIQALLPSRASRPEAVMDIFTPLARFYLEMGEFVEVAGVTCESPEAVPWLLEAAFLVLGRTGVTIRDRPVPLCHTPTDYNNYTSCGEWIAHSAGSHANLLCRRALGADEFAQLASILCPLNVVFGPGGLTWSEERVPRFSCDPRADHVAHLVACQAHGESRKPFILCRNEPLAERPSVRIQIVGFGGTRSPVSSWLRAELLTWALRAVQHREKPPVLALEPLSALRAAPQTRINVKRRRSHAVAKSQVAIDTICWLADSAGKRATDAVAVERVQYIRKLACAAVHAAVTPDPQPPVLPTDIVVKRFLFDRIAQQHGFADLETLCAQATPVAGERVKSTMDAVIVNDILFSSSEPNLSSYEHAARAGVFLRPEFAFVLNDPDLARLPPGVCSRARTRAAMLVAGDLQYCNWNTLITKDGGSKDLPNPWSS